MAGDPVQKILVKRLSLRDAGLAEGSAVYRRIKKNYRNSRQILRAASKIANVYGEQARKSGEEIDVLDPELAARETAKPFAVKTDNQVKKAWELARQSLAEGQTQAWTICIATASAHEYPPEAVLAMRPAGLQAEPLSGDYMMKPDTVVVSTLNDLKGFEFNLVLIVGCDEGLCPANGVAEGEVWREALRFYVCMTRARDQVYMLYEGEPSQFLREMGDRIVWSEEALKQDYQPAPAAPNPPPAARRMSFASVLAQQGLSPHDTCEARLSEESLQLLRLFFDAVIDETKRQDCRGYTQRALDELDHRATAQFHRWVTPNNLAHLRASKFGPWRRADRKAIQRLDQELRSIGVTTFLGLR